MSKKKNNTTTLLLVAGVAAVGYYLYTKSAAGSSGVVAPGLPTTLSTGSLPNTGTGSLATPLPSTANDPRLVVINEWVNTLDAANANAARNALAIMSQDEIASLYDIVQNDFYGNGITTDAQRAFWNTWRVKYHVNDGTYA
jgi:hypothetical protein